MRLNRRAGKFANARRQRLNLRQQSFAIGGRIDRRAGGHQFTGRFGRKVRKPLVGFEQHRVVIAPVGKLERQHVGQHFHFFLQRVYQRRKLTRA